MNIITTMRFGALLLLAIALPVHGLSQDNPTPQLSAATKRLRVHDSKNELYTRFRYRPVNGLGYEEGVNRRDPSSIIKVGNLYYVWYTRNQSTRSKWLEADICYATSPDGIGWTERGPAVQRGPEGAWDDCSVFTCNILVADGKFECPDYSCTGYKIIIEHGSWDSAAVHDPGIIPRWGKYWLYYKGHGLDDLIYADSKWGVAVADHPQGPPYIKSPLNPVTNSGHEVWVWPWKKGIAAMVDWAGPEKGTVQYTEDGVNFEVMASLEDIPPAGGAYIPDKFVDPADGQDFTWGVAHYGRSDWNFLVRFDCDLHRESEKQLSWEYFPHYSTIRDVMRDPGRFNVPQDALVGQQPRRK